MPILNKNEKRNCDTWTLSAADSIVHPFLGVASEVQVKRVPDPKTLDYFIDAVAYMLDDGSTRTISLFDIHTGFSMDNLQAPNEFYWVKVCSLNIPF